MSGRRSKTTRATLVLCGSVIVTCSPEAPRAPEAPRVVTGNDATHHDAHRASTGSDQELEVSISEVVRIRGLPALARIELRRVNRLEMRNEVQRHINAEIPSEVIAGQSDLLEALGLVPRGFDYVAAILRLMGDKLAGFYDPHGGRMLLAEDLSREDLQMTLKHEIVHALQDQHFDLGRGLAYRPDAADIQSALHGLAEGDATSAMLDEELGPDAILADDALLVERFSSNFAGEMRDVPEILKRSAIAPYKDGLLFVNQLRRTGGWRAVNLAWRKPPLTSEQLLHPEKYLSSEPGSAIPRSPTRSGCQETYSDILGEQALRLVFEEWATDQDAREAASGWDGDRATLFSCGTEKHLHWRVSFDTTSDASEGEQLFLAGRARCPVAGRTQWEVVREDRLVTVNLRHPTDCYAPGGQFTP